LIDFTYIFDKPNNRDFYNLFQTTGWYEGIYIDEYKIETILKNSWFMVSVYNKDQLIGFGRIISDLCLHALILDVIIIPEFQRKGIGTKIMDILLDKCLKEEIIDIQLFCAMGIEGFYKKLGFEKRDINAPGMQYNRKFRRING